MKHAKFLMIAVAIIFSLSLASTSFAESDAIFGAVNNHQYSNSVFKFSVQIPANWHVDTLATKKAISKMGNQIKNSKDAQIAKI